MNVSTQHPFGTYWCDPEAFHPRRVNTVDVLVETLFEQGKRPEQQVFWDDANLCWNSGKWAGEGFENWFYIAVDTAPENRINLLDYLPTVNNEFGADARCSFRENPTTVVKAVAQLKLVKNAGEELSRFRQENLGTPLEAAFIWNVPKVVFVTTGSGVNYKVLQTWNQNGKKVEVINRQRLKEVYDYHPTVWQNFYNDLLTKQAEI